MKNIFKNKTILITGAGYLGTKLAEKLLKYNPYAIRCVNHSEYPLYCLKEKLKDPRIRCILKDINDKDGLRIAMEGAHIVIHTASIKHIDISQYNSVTAVKTNVMGTINLIECALDSPDLQKFVNISSDKAVEPISVYGATKFLQEEMTTWASRIQRGDKVFYSLRFGNFYGSIGSVVPKWTEQAKKGEPLTLSDKRMKRYFIKTDDVVDSIIESLSIAKPGEIFIPNKNIMQNVSMYDIAKSISDNVKVTGLYRLEKFEEKVCFDHEKPRLEKATKNLNVLRPIPHKQIRGYEKVKDFVNKW